MIPLKSKEDLVMLDEAGQILAGIMQELASFVRPGRKTAEIDSFAQDLMRRKKVVSAFKDYQGFPAHICTSLNEEIVHGIPGEREIKENDIMSIDLGINYQGYFVDAAITVAIGKIDAQKRKLLSVAKKALYEGIKKACAGNHLSDISWAIQNYVEKKGFSVVRQFVGHGIGLNLHEEPEIPNFGMAGNGPLLKSGMVFAIEPMVNIGTWEARILDNGWTAVTKDGLSSAHFEHTVAITEKRPKILTHLN